MRLALIAHPDSGSADPDGVEQLLRGHGVDVVRFEPGDWETAVAGADRIVVASGDGLVAPAAVAAGRAGLPLAVVPSGTANDFASAMGIPDDREDACRLAATGTHIRPVDIAWCNDEPFVNVASAGLSVVASRESEALKPTFGPAGYSLAALRAAFTAKALDVRIETDGELLHEGPMWQVLIANTGAFGGGASVDAEPDDARLKVVVLERGPRLRLARHAWGLRIGDVDGQPGVVSARARQVVVTFPGRRSTSINCDGDLEDVGLQARFRVDGAAVGLIVPVG